MNKEKIKLKLENAMKKFKEKDEYLMKIDVSERCMAHKIATYLSREFRSYDVDVEYNRRFDYVKKIEIEGKGFGIYPDIIIHKRGNQNKNLLVIEIKKDTSNLNQEEDLKKLKNMTRPFPEDIEENQEKYYGYKYGCALKNLTEVYNTDEIDELIKFKYKDE